MVKEGKDNEAFWTVAIGLPVLLSVLRLWVEAGGELQTTLLLVEHIDPVNLVAAMVATATWLVTAMFVAALALGGVLNASGEAGQGFWLARWAARAPLWLKAGSFALAAITWQVLYLPLLVLAACAAYQLRPRGWPGWLAVTGLAAAYGYLIGPVVADAWRLGPSVYVMTYVLLLVPPLLSLVIAGPLAPGAVRPIAILTPLASAVLLAWIAVPLVQTPILPHTVTMISAPPDQSPGAPKYIGGHIVTSDNTHTAILAQQGGITYVRNERIEAQYLCPTDEEFPRYPLRIHRAGLSIELEHSVLRGLGRANRAGTPLHPACRVPAGK